MHTKKNKIENIQGRINKIRYSVEERQSHVVWQTINEASKRKNTSKTKLKAASQEERIHMWKEHFKNLLVKSLKVIDKPITKITNQLDIKIGKFTQGERRSTNKN